MSHEELTMTSSSLRDAIFTLGRISVDVSITNESLLRRLAEVTARTLDVQVVALGVFEEGIERNATTCFVLSPWTLADGGAFQDQAFWSVEDRGLAHRLGALRRGRVYHRPDLLSDAERRPLGRIPGMDGASVNLDDQALALYRRRDGTELLIGINSPAGAGSLPRGALAKAGALAPFLAQCWAVAWRREPEWVRALKPHSRVVLERLLQGCDDDQIAQLTSLSYHSVRAHLKRMFKAAGVRSRLHLMQACRRSSGRSPSEVELCLEAAGEGAEADEAASTPETPPTARATGAAVA